MKCEFFLSMALAMVTCGCCDAALPTNDDFNGISKNATKWGSDLVVQHGFLSQTNQRVEFTVNGAPTVFDQSVRPWTPSKGPYTSDWEVQVDTLNTLILSGTTNQQVAAGIAIDDGRGIVSNEIIAVQTGTAFSPQPYVGFMGRLGAPDTGTFASAINLPVTNGAVRIAFNSATKVLTLYYDTNPTNGYTWTQFASFGINGSGGADANMSWGMSDTDQISIGIYGYAINSAVAAGEVGLDNFQATGLVTPIIGTLSKVTEKCKTKNLVTTCKLGGSLALLNNGAGAAPPMHVRFFLSTDTNYDDGVDTLLGESTTKTIKPGKSGKGKLKAVTGASSAGQFILAVDDDDKLLASFQVPSV